MFKNALIFRITQWQRPELTELEERLAGGRFAACGATQMEAIGWVAPRGEKHGAMVESVGGHLIFALRTERKAVPSSVIKTQLDERLEKIEAETGRRPKGRQAKEIKEQIVHELLPRAFPKRSGTWVWVDTKAATVVIGATGSKAVDGVLTLLGELLGGGIVLAPLQTAVAPATAMSEWLSSKQAPAGFSIDRECELKQPDSEKASVRYARHTLEIDEVAEHIQQGKRPTQLAMTWDGRVSFMLTETLAIKKIKMLDVVLEGPAAAGKDDGFDADVAITTGELGRLIPDLVAALGGEAAEPGAAPLPAPAAEEALAA